MTSQARGHSALSRLYKRADVIEDLQGIVESANNTDLFTFSIGNNIERCWNNWVAEAPQLIEWQEVQATNFAENAVGIFCEKLCFDSIQMHYAADEDSRFNYISRRRYFHNDPELDRIIDISKAPSEYISIEYCSRIYKLVMLGRKIVYFNPTIESKRAAKIAALAKSYSEDRSRARNVIFDLYPEMRGH